MGHTLVSLIPVTSCKQRLIGGSGKSKKTIKIGKKKESKKLENSALKSQKNCAKKMKGLI